MPDSLRVADTAPREERDGVDLHRAARFLEVVSEVVAAVDALLPTRVTFVSRIDGPSFEIIDSIEHEAMGFHPGLVVDTADTF